MKDIFEPGSVAPDFELYNQDNEKVTLTDFRGKWLILYFYPKDNTPGCTVEALDFTELSEEFKKARAEIVGVSKDSVKSHKNFCEKKNLNLILLSDPEAKVCRDYKAWGIKKNYGREYEGLIRSTLIIDPEGKIAFHFKNVRAKGHAERVLKQFKEMI
ncbi:MAG: thioredoxin-dependent thiol peroxidase [Candidatus Cloacimonadota bacterium]|nr:MAG: thioredoxin-dependent thiol peroxidase [Candidatus Cloacimonadota bacterium]